MSSFLPRIVIEGHGDEEMPEQMLAACSIERAQHENFLLVVDVSINSLQKLSFKLFVKKEEAQKKREAEKIREAAARKRGKSDSKKQKSLPGTPPAPTVGAPPPPGNDDSSTGAEVNGIHSERESNSLGSRIGSRLGLW